MILHLLYWYGRNEYDNPPISFNLVTGNTVSSQWNALDETTQNRIIGTGTVFSVVLPAVSVAKITQFKQFASKADATKGGTYVLKDADGVVKRTGKSNNLDRRRGEHARNSETKDLEFEVDRRTDCCDAQRGREQIIYDRNPQAQSANGGLNKRRPVSPRNPKRDIYRKAGEGI